MFQLIWMLIKTTKSTRILCEYGDNNTFKHFLTASEVLKYVKYIFTLYPLGGTRRHLMQHTTLFFFFFKYLSFLNLPPQTLLDTLIRINPRQRGTIFYYIYIHAQNIVINKAYNIAESQEDTTGDVIQECLNHQYKYIFHFIFYIYRRPKTADEALLRFLKAVVRMRAGRILFY